MTSRRIITDNTSLRAQFNDLGADDIVVGRIRLKPSEEYLLIDLLERRVHLIPSALSQMASRSKTFQVLMLAEFMLPHTHAVHELHKLIQLLNLYGASHIDQVVTKHDRKNAGLGIFLWPSVEQVYTHASHGLIQMPFLIQPYFPGCQDIRVIILDDYIEAYTRHNPDNFRNNLHCGGASEPCDLTPAQLALCRQVMARGRFPYAHIDLMVTEQGKTYVSEINLRGGIRGARVETEAYHALVKAIDNKLLQEILDNSGT